jgi:16S rRNA (guanine527-N7)-methyltransferase
MKGAGVAAEIEAASKQIRAFKLQNVEVLTLGEGLLDEVTRVVRATVE